LSWDSCPLPRKSSLSLGLYRLTNGSWTIFEHSVLDADARDFNAREVRRANAARFRQFEGVVTAQKRICAASRLWVVTHNGHTNGVDANWITAGNQQARLDDGNARIP